MPDRSTIYEVARLSGVSTATVSRVMGSRGGYSAATEQRVHDVARSLGWFPNAAASGLASRRVGIVGLVFPATSGEDAEDARSPLFLDQVVRGAERAASAAGDAVLIAAARSTGDAAIARGVVGKVDGLVVLAGALPDEEVAEIGRTRPVVAMLGPLAGAKDVVRPTDSPGVGELTTHLVRDHGYDDLVFLAGPKDSPVALRRLTAYRDARRAAGHRPRSDDEAYGDFTHQGGQAAMRRLLEARRTPPRAVVAGNDQMALGALSVLADAGLRVPEDVAVTGYDDVAAARYARPALTTVDQPMLRLGARAVEVLLERIADPDAPPRDVQLETRLVLRRSCGCPDPDTTGAPPRNAPRKEPS